MLIAYERRIDLVRQLDGTSEYFDAYQAVDQILDRPVFVKLARGINDALGAAVVQAHVRQWRALAREIIPHVPRILDLGQHDGRWFLSTEWIDSPSLSTFFETPHAVTDPGEVVLGLLDRCLSILAGLHAAGFVHGDISSRNILANPRMDPKSVYLIDPAPPLDLPDPSDTTRRLILGNRAFLAPEVLAGRALTIRADLFALGKVVSEFARILRTNAPSLVSLMTAEKPQDRPASADDALTLLCKERLQLAANQAPGAPLSSTGGELLSEGDTFGGGKTVLIDVPRSESDSWTAVSMAVSVPVPLNASKAVAAGIWDVPTAVHSIPVPEPAMHETPVHADFSIMAPSHIQPGRHFVLEVWAALSSERDKMLEEATRSGRMIERGHRSHVEIGRDALITVLLKLPDFEVADPVETLGWNGSIRNVGFIVKVPPQLAPGVYPGSAKLMLGQVPFASILFDLEVSITSGADLPAQELSTRVQRIARAFASYASQDRTEVLRRVQGIQATGTSVFLDLLALRSGEDWERALYREIDASDRLFLFWSRSAARSSWVEREWRFALDRRGLDFIDPVPLEDPRCVPPPEELKSKHFNDMVLGFITIEEAMARSAGHRFE